MQKLINLFSTLLIKIFGLASNTSCAGYYGEPDYPEELLK
ncbi:cyclic lactone autoinducer peptide [Clostridium sp. YIM B02569]|nr:cyclic lactone autoinducer peptide [Clostridium sp. YIM B02569]